MKRGCAAALHKSPAYTAAGHRQSIQLALHQDRFAGACATLAAWASPPQDRLDKRPAACGLPGNRNRIEYIIKYVKYIKNIAVRIGDVHQLKRIAHADRAMRKSAPAKMLPIEAGDMRHPKPRFPDRSEFMD